MNNTNIFSTHIHLTHKIAKILLGIVAMVAMSNLVIPIQPVPITFSTIMIMAIGLTYSRGEAFSTIGSWLALGAMGAPVFTNGFSGGIPYMIGSTGGYLFGFLIAAYCMAYMREKFTLPMLYNCMLGHILIYIPGVLWLATFIGMEAAIYKGFIIYIPTGMLKIGCLVVLMRIIGRKS